MMQRNSVLAARPRDIAKPRRPSEPTARGPPINPELAGTTRYEKGRRCCHQSGSGAKAADRLLKWLALSKRFHLVRPTPLRHSTVASYPGNWALATGPRNERFRRNGVYPETEP